MDENIKGLLYETCNNYVENRIKNARDAMENAQQSANSETKSTAGDKHDTSRAMMQLEAEQNAKHLAEAQKLKKAMHLIDPEKEYTNVELGALVICSTGNFYISISAGKLELNDTIYYAISPSSPLAQTLKGLKKGDSATFNGRNIDIKDIK